jgi:hypothetical protein
MNYSIEMTIGTERVVLIEAMLECHHHKFHYCDFKVCCPSYRQKLIIGINSNCMMNQSEHESRWMEDEKRNRMEATI